MKELKTKREAGGDDSNLTKQLRKEQTKVLPYSQWSLLLTMYLTYCCSYRLFSVPAEINAE